MNIRELQQSFESRIKGMRGFIYKQARENQDLRQEACLAMWRGLLKNPGATDGLDDPEFLPICTAPYPCRKKRG